MKFVDITLADASLEARLESLGIVLDKEFEVIDRRVETITKLQGPKGDKGDQGEQGLPGKDGKDGRNGIDGRNGVDGKDGRDGSDGKQGVGVANAYIDFDNSLVIELTDGNEINAGELNLEQLKKELVVRNSSGALFDPNSLPAATDYPFPDEIIVNQNGKWVRASFYQFVTWLAIPDPFDKVLTEASEPILTENSDNIIRN